MKKLSPDIQIYEHSSNPFVPLPVEGSGPTQVLPTDHDAKITNWSISENGEKIITRSLLSELGPRIQDEDQIHEGEGQSSESAHSVDEPAWKAEHYDDNVKLPEDEPMDCKIDTPSLPSEASKSYPQDHSYSQHPEFIMYPAFDTPSTLTSLDEESDIDNLSVSDKHDDFIAGEYPKKKRRMLEVRDMDFMNPTYKIKISKEATDAGFGSCFQRVDALGIKPFTVDSPQNLLDFTITRKFMSSVYGGNSEDTFPKIGAEKMALHPYRDFMFINLEYNPYAPQRAGHPGLFYRLNGDDFSVKVYRLFIRIKSGVWLYVGQYEPIASTPLTSDEFAANGSKTKQAWLDHVMCKKKDVIKNTRSRILLRKTLGREPSNKEVQECSGRGLTEKDVYLAFSRGEERINVWVMKAVGYDEEFQREMEAKFSEWVPHPAQRKKKKGAVKPQPARKRIRKSEDFEG